jgi:hypothetical protein
MLFRDQFDERADALYKSQYNLAAPVKNGQGIVLRPRLKLPFSKDEFCLWLWREVGLQAKMCPYGCGRAIDILNCSIDHKIPRGQDGSFALTNLMACCVECNTLKGNMSADSFLVLMKASREMWPKDWELLSKRIMIGNTAQQERWRAIRAGRELKKFKGELPAPRQASTPLAFKGGFDPEF